MPKTNSIWTDTAKRNNFKALKGDAKTDVLIIGGGIAGVLTAYMLTKAGIECILLEADKICGGITENTTAKITVQHGLIFNKMIKRYGHITAKMYLEAQRDALEKYRKLCSDIPCDFEEQTSYVYSRKNKQKIEDEAAALKSLGCPVILTSKTSLPFAADAVGIEGQVEFNPLKFLFEIAKGLPVFENTKVLEMGDNTAVTTFGTISFKRAVVATHFPIINKHGAYFLKLHQHRSYVLALENATEVDGMYVDEDIKGMSFRSYNGVLLLGGGSHRTGKSGGGWAELESFAAEHYKDSRIINRWATQDCMTLDDIPYIGQYSASTQNLYVATGFNKWGMTSSMVAASLLTDILKGKETDYAEVFSPSRSILHPKLFENAAESVIGLITPTKPRCPHMGCALKYNRAEHSWDCPCHGSRFSEDGELINNPATDDKKP